MKKQSKYAILTGAADYLQQFQKQSSQLSTDLEKIVKDTSTSIHHPVLPSCRNDTIKTDRVRRLEIEQAAENERLSFFLKGEDAALHSKKTFYSAPVPLALVGIDGKFLEMNTMFMKVSRLPLDYLQHISLFKLVQPSCLHDCYSKIAEMLLPGNFLIHAHTHPL